MHRLRHRSGFGLRFALALALLIAGIAGARMQGGMAAQAALGLGALCSGEAVPAPDGTPATGGHAGCLTCPLPFAATPDAPQAPVRTAFVVARPVSALDSALCASEPSFLKCRGPPLAG